MTREGMIKEYTGDKITVVWEPDLCIHSGICLKGLPEVFNLRERPWVKVEGATAEQVVAQVRECPSKALRIKGVRFKEDNNPDTEVVLIPGGPLIIKGGATVKERRNEKVFHETVSFCRCGRSARHPFCDGTHAKKR